MVIVFTVGCSTPVTFNSNDPGAVVYVNGAPLGKTPCTISLSNAVWESYSIRITKDGYQDIVQSDLRREVKVVPICFCWLFLVPLLWDYGPMSYQNYQLVPTAK